MLQKRSMKKDMGEELGIQLKLKEIGKLLTRDDDESEYMLLSSCAMLCVSTGVKE